MYFKVYFILAHHKPEQLEALVTMLQDGQSIFFIHLDAGTAIKNFKCVENLTNCFFIRNRVRCRWGDFSLVRATLNSLQEIQDYMKSKYADANYHCMFLSGEDLPLKSNAAIHNYFESRQELSFMNYWKLPYDKWWGGGLFRFESLFIFDFRKYPKANYWMNRMVKKLKLNTVLPIEKIKRNFPDMELFGSSQWMILSKDLLKFIVEKSNGNEKFDSLFKHVLAPDELYIPTLVNYYRNTFKIENTATHLVIFKGSNASPEYLTIEDIISNRDDFWFARKFDAVLNPDSISYIHKIIGA